MRYFLSAMVIGLCWATLPPEVSGWYVIRHRPAVQLAGKDSKMEKPGHFRIASSQEWDKLWQTHRGQGGTAPQIDFDKYMAIAIFLGPQQETYEVQVKEIVEQKGGGMYLIYRRAKVQDTSGPSSPYCLLVLPRNLKGMRVYEDVHPRPECGGTQNLERATFVDASKP